MDLTKQSKIELDTILTKVKRGESTYFLDEKKIEYIHNILKKQNINHNIFYPYNGATYGLIYHDKLNVSLLKIKIHNINPTHTTNIVIPIIILFISYLSFDVCYHHLE